MLSSKSFGIFSSAASSAPSKYHSQGIVFSIHTGQDITSLTVHSKPNEAYVYWYFGANGFKQGAIDFYKEFITKNIKLGATPYLVDLTAWSAFIKKEYRITQSHGSAESLANERLQILKCSDFFASLKKIKPNEKAFHLLVNIVKRKELYAVSSDFSEVGICVGEVFNYDCPSLESIYELDCAKSYSIIQYIEFLFLVEMILLKNKSDIDTIRFILPNDENKYYFPSMAEDLNHFLSVRGIEIKQLNIQVQCFTYGDALSHRPYNAPSKTIPLKKRLAFEKIIDVNALAQAAQQDVRQLTHR